MGDLIGIRSMLEGGLGRLLGEVKNVMAVMCGDGGRPVGRG